MNWLRNTPVATILVPRTAYVSFENTRRQVRAYRAWRAIKRRELVEVTSYPWYSELLGVRRTWDAARIVRFFLAAFFCASWGLELQTDLAHIEDGPVDFLAMPPPVYLRGEGNNADGPGR